MKGFARLLLLAMVVAALFLAGCTATGEAIQVSTDVLNLFVFMFVVPVLVQVVKVVAEKKGKPAADWVLQVVALVISVLYAFFNGTLGGLTFPTFPVWGGDLGTFVSLILGFIVELVAFIGLAWGPVEIAYRAILKAAFEKPSIGGKVKLLPAAKP